MNRSLAVLLLGSSLLTWTACSNSSAPPQTATLANSDVERTIKNRIGVDAVLNAAKLDVDADVDSRSNTLSGIVESQAARLQVVNLAREAQPGFAITDKIDVKPLDVSLEQYTDDMASRTREAARCAGDKLGDSLEDAWLHTKVTATLAANRSMPARKVNVDVVKNVVTLRGEVETAEAKREAEQVVSETDGVWRVVNLLKVRL